MSTPQSNDPFRLTVPIKHRFYGDRDAAISFTGSAHREMAILETSLAFQGLKQGVRKVTPLKGVFIECRKWFDLREIIITVIAGKLYEAMYKEECLCNCNFSVGWVVELQDTDLDTIPLYTVAACNFKTKYVIYSDVLASDWCKYIPMQKVILIPYFLMPFLCCTEPRMDYGADQGYGCRPELSPEEIISEDWRTVYRIIPWNAFTVPKKVNIRRTQSGDV